MAYVAEPWYRDPATLRLIGRRYLPWLAGLSLAWEVVQLPLYTIWEEGSAGWIAFAVAHCTAGDILIGLVCLVAALVITRARSLRHWNWAAIGVLIAALGVAYTAWSEWANTLVRASWAYSRWMPTLALGGAELGLSPLLQWLVVPPLALRLARRSLHP